MNADTRKAINYVKEMADQQFWGFISLKFENGIVVHVRREENIKPDQIHSLPETNGRNSYVGNAS